MNHYIVSCEFRGNRRDTVEVPVSVIEVSVIEGIDYGPTIACEKAERIASEQFGGTLNQWFAWKVEPDNE